MQEIMTQGFMRSIENLLIALASSTFDSICFPNMIWTLTLLLTVMRSTRRCNSYSECSSSCCCMGEVLLCKAIVCLMGADRMLQCRQSSD